MKMRIEEDDDALKQSIACIPPLEEFDALDSIVLGLRSMQLYTLSENLSLRSSIV